MTDTSGTAGRKLIRNSKAEFLIFTAQGDEASIEARYEDETIWLSQRIMAELFGVDVRTVNEHLRNIFTSGELDAEPTIRKLRIVQREGARDVTRSVEHYNLDAIISVGYRVNSVRATQFRQWATGCRVISATRRRASASLSGSCGELQPEFISGRMRAPETEDIHTRCGTT